MIDRNTPSITKAQRIYGDTLIFRDTIVSDAEFILSLRLDAGKSRYLSETAQGIAAQRTWLERYSTSVGQAYFIIEFNGESIGTVRLYDARGVSFCWGSWILKDGRPRHAAMESALMVYAYAMDHLGFDECHFDVRKGNDRVIRFHERFGAVRTGETELDYLFRIDRTAIQGAREKYTQFLSSGVTVSGLEST